MTSDITAFRVEKLVPGTRTVKLFAVTIDNTIQHDFKAPIKVNDEFPPLRMYIAKTNQVQQKIVLSS